MEDRIIGSRTSLYAMPTTRIVGLTTDRFDRDGNDGYFTIDRHAVLLPPKLAVLIDRQIASPSCHTSCSSSRTMARPASSSPDAHRAAPDEPNPSIST
ncbi:hypothetical protein ACWGHA_32890 [Streptomyces xanthophaeus]